MNKIAISFIILCVVACSGIGTIKSVPIAVNDSDTEKSKIEGISRMFRNLNMKITQKDYVAYKKSLKNREINKDKIDSLVVSAYRDNANGEYLESITTSEQILNLDPSNFSAYKEIGLSYKRLGNEEKYKKYYEFGKHYARLIFQQGNGEKKTPFYLTNQKEVFSVIEAVYFCYTKYSNSLNDVDNIHIHTGTYGSGCKDRVWYSDI